MESLVCEYYGAFQNLVVNNRRIVVGADFLKIWGMLKFNIPINWQSDKLGDIECHSINLSAYFFLLLGGHSSCSKNKSVIPALIFRAIHLP